MNIKSWRAQPIARRIGALMLIASVAIASAACSEIPQDARKPFASENDTATHTGEKFKGDRALYEKTLRERAEKQDEYRMLAR